MRDRLTYCIRHLKTVILATILIVALSAVFIFGQAQELNTKSVICNLDDYTLYPNVLKQILPTYSVEQSENIAYYTLDNGSIAEAFDTQAIGALKLGKAKHWYPQYLATVIIAIDRDKTNVLVNSWSDLYESGQQVAFFDTPGNVQMLTAAMSYGLEGEHYTLTKAIDLLASLHDDDRLIINSFDAPIIICYDYQAATLIDSGRNIEIIIPKEGTLTYKKGLLSNEIIAFTGDVNALLLDANFRLLDGQSDASIYPDETAYMPAVQVADYEDFAIVTQKVTPLIERKVLKYNNLMSIDSGEHLYFALVYIILVTLWVASFIQRSIQKGIGHAAFFMGIILNGWTMVRLIKYQIIVAPIITRYLWYSFYLFQLTLPLVLLWMAWAIDKPEDKILPPKWWQSIAIIVSGLIIIVFTNDLHGLVLRLDLTRPDWGINYGYGPGYYIIFFVCMANIVAVLAMLIHKSMKSTNKKGFMLPLALFLLFVVYNIGYIMREPFLYKTDITIVTGLFAMLMFEACIRSGLIPVNTKYIDLFARSPLKIQIINKEGKMVLASASAISLDELILDKIVESSSVQILQDNNSLLLVNSIPGGYAIWHEDISKIIQLHSKIKQSTQMLTKANAILSLEEKLKRHINEKNAKVQLMQQLETEITESLTRLQIMIDALPISDNYTRDATRILLLLCYIKRRCNLFFREQESDSIDAEILIVYIDELCEMAKRSKVLITTSSDLKGSLNSRHATLFYDFFYEVTDLAIDASCPYVIEHLGVEEESITLRLLPAQDIKALNLNPKLIEAIATAQGSISIKDIEDTIGISISFLKGVFVND